MREAAATLHFSFPAPRRRTLWLRMSPAGRGDALAGSRGPQGSLRLADLAPVLIAAAPPEVSHASGRSALDKGHG